MDKNSTEGLLTRAIVELFDEERFYAELIIQMDKIISDKVPTAGVCIKNTIQLNVNPEFFKKLSLKEQVAVLKHECQHIFNDHIARSKDLMPEVYEKNKDIADALINNAKHQVMNVAADCAINEGIPDLPEGACYPKTFDMPPRMTFEYYVENLKNNEKAKDMSSFDDHTIWTESDGEKEELREKIKKAVNKAASNTRAAGKMSADDELIVDKVNYVPKDWKGDLRRFVARAQETRLESSKKKRNRRYGVMYPGTIKEDTLHIGVAMDTSGSVSDEALCQFMAEIGNIAKYAVVTVVEADSEVKASYVYDPKKTYKVKGRGGTAYQPAFDYFTKETDVDGVIYLGDMDSSDKPKKPKYPVLWAIIGSQNPPATWGSKTYVEIKRKGSV